MEDGKVRVVEMTVNATPLFYGFSTACERTLKFAHNCPIKNPKRPMKLRPWYVVKVKHGYYTMQESVFTCFETKLT